MNDSGVLSALFPVRNGLKVLHKLDHGVVVLDFSEGDQHVVDVLLTQHVRIVQSSLHVSQIFLELLPCQLFSTFSQIREELFFQVNLTTDLHVKRRQIGVSIQFYNSTSLCPVERKCKKKYFYLRLNLVHLQEMSEFADHADPHVLVDGGRGFR